MKGLNETHLLSINSLDIKQKTMEQTNIIDINWTIFYYTLDHNYSFTILSPGLYPNQISFSKKNHEIILSNNETLLYRYRGVKSRTIFCFTFWIMSENKFEVVSRDENVQKCLPIPH